MSEDMVRTKACPLFAKAKISVLVGPVRWECAPGAREIVEVSGEKGADRKLSAFSEMENLRSALGHAALGFQGFSRSFTARKIGCLPSRGVRTKTCPLFDTDMVWHHCQPCAPSRRNSCRFLPRRRTPSSSAIVCRSGPRKPKG